MGYKPSYYETILIDSPTKDLMTKMELGIWDTIKDDASYKICTGLYVKVV